MANDLIGINDSGRAIPAGATINIDGQKISPLDKLVIEDFDDATNTGAARWIRDGEFADRYPHLADRI